MPPITDNTLLIEDTKNRAIALDINQSFIVQAPAGSGKTELLTQRFLKLLAQADTPESIVALTFTNKAADEMRERIIQQLIRSQQEPPPKEAHHKISYDLGSQVLKTSQIRKWDLLDHTQRLRIQTMDSFCLGITQQLPLTSRMGAEAKIVENDSKIFLEAINLTLEREKTTAKQLTQAVDSMIEYFDFDRASLVTLLHSMLQNRDQWTHWLYQQDITASDQTKLWEDWINLVISNTVDQVFAPHSSLLIWPLLEELEQMPSLTENIAFNLTHWKAVAALSLTKTGYRKRAPTNLSFKTKTDQKTWKKRYQEWLEFLNLHQKSDLMLSALITVQNLPDIPTLTDIQWDLMQQLIILLQAAHANLWVLFSEQKAVDFIQVTHQAIQALSHDTHIQQENQIQHLLVDEFQDTNPTQLTLIKQITRHWERNSECTLFLVGDPMQSIYRFRKADVGLFLKVKTSGLDSLHPKLLTLYRNNRSSPTIIHWINEQFKAIFPKVDDPFYNGIKFTAATATRTDPPFTEVITPVFATQHDEIQYVIQQIETHKKNNPQQSIAVLSSTKKYLQNFINEIQRSKPNIAIQAVEIDTIYSHQVIQDLLSLTTALHNPNDRQNWLAILRAPWCGLTLSDLHLLAADNKLPIWERVKNPPDSLSPDAQKRLNHFRYVMEQALNQRTFSRLRRWLECTWITLGGRDCLRTEREANLVIQYFNLIDQLFESSPYQSNVLYEAITTQTESFQEINQSAVQFMTIHKSKGLEYDTVFIVNSTGRANNRIKQQMVWEHLESPDASHGSRTLLAFPPPKNKPLDKNKTITTFEYLNTIESERNLHEKKRVFYVAATRARDCLYLTGVLPPETNPPSNSMLSWLTTEPERLTPAETSPNTPEIQPNESTLIRLSQLTHEETQIPLLSRPEPAHYSEIDLTTTSANETMIVGQLVHRYLQRIADEGLAQWSDERVNKLTPYLLQFLVSRNLNTELTKHILALVKATLDSERGRWILSPHDEGANELSRSTWIDGELRTWRVDRTFVTQRTRWIIDYKTSPTLPDTTILQKYYDQLNQYALLFDDYPVRKGIYFMAFDHWIEY
jgi:ATP-dependent exoDNAse (exonuclease V) beta subunit